MIWQRQGNGWFVPERQQMWPTVTNEEIILDTYRKEFLKYVQYSYKEEVPYAVQYSDMQQALFVINVRCKKKANDGTPSSNSDTLGLTQGVLIRGVFLFQGLFYIRKMCRTPLYSAHMQCPHYCRCPHFRGVVRQGSTVVTKFSSYIYGLSNIHTTNNRSQSGLVASLY